MKSIIQESSTIVKALQQAWDEAGKPQEFTVKVLQEPETNFFGMTTKSAKVVIFFKDAPIVRQVEKRQRPARKAAERQPQPKRQQQKRKLIERRELPTRQERKQPEKPMNVPQEQGQQTYWSDDMVGIVSDWMNGALKAMNLADVRFDTSAERYLLTLKLNKALHADNAKEKDIFRSFSLLVMQSLKHKLKRPLRGFKVLVTRA